MATSSMFSMEAFPVGVSMMDGHQNLGELDRNSAAPQLVMLANVAVEGYGEGSVADEKEMMELMTVGCSYSDSEDDNVIRYTYDNQNPGEVCSVDYSETVGLCAVPGINDGQEDKDLSQDSERPKAQADPKAKDGPPGRVLSEAVKKKKPLHCKPCQFQAENEEEFVEHLRTHASKKMMVINRVKGRSKGQQAEAGQGQLASGEEDEEEEEPSAESKGLICCERCGYNTNRLDHYVAHLKHHTKEGDDHRVFKCTLCAYSTISQYHWRKHLRNHFPSKLHTCTQCSYYSDRKSNYIQHIRTHTGVRPFQCPFCQYSSSQKTHLTRHMRTHSGERPFKCESCDYLAANQHEVTRHARQVHNGPKPLVCPYCDYKTADRSNFKKHVELHLNPRQFLCPLCKYAASKKCNLQYHIKSRHAGCQVTLDVSKVKLRLKKQQSSTKVDQEEDEEEPDQEHKSSDPVKKQQSSNKVDHEEEPDQEHKSSDPVKKQQSSTKVDQEEDEEEPDREHKPSDFVNLSSDQGQEPKEAPRQGKVAKTDKWDGRAKKTKENQQDVSATKTKRRAKKAAADGPPDPPQDGHRVQTKGGGAEKPRGARAEEPAQTLVHQERLQKREKGRKRGAGSSSGPAPKARRLRPGSKSASREQVSEESAKRTRSSTRKCPPPKVQESSVKTTCEASTTPHHTQDLPLSSPPPDKMAEAEDDEGVHSSHEGASDISDCASEGSVDSGLNSNAANNDPDTPTQEVPSPTQLKSHMCIFCDRHFPLEAEYRRHLNRHLVNVYYMDHQ
ncbi:RE1-silencing transcription factor B-like [Nerophis ophidion]|uniref:RE1-silencing transcription factor B-like n=1 Tax=Nerophis ophidion TaxID=159077 RepID=UPI002AE02236|nr:RE1-silencing transcription factor B-like [Nerophis ophidion]XP_061748116.1 RE1-silencing transcription factor B-like [Nerophis ophidion]XP_061749394.1 RE1-silencing transcription factor B-like [Nerophis ophidion]XP_061749395.1 RE1-silencing transcription factor B-like [Nerophis ophidion]